MKTDVQYCSPASICPSFPEARGMMFFAIGAMAIGSLLRE
jgi:hypothetical protein